MNAERSLIAVVLLAGLAACKAKDEGDETPAPAVNAQTIVVAPQAFTETLGAIGTVVTRSGHVATLSAPTQARVAQVLVSAGQSVTAGQPLVQLDQAPLAASLQAAEAAFTAAERAADRQQRLANEGIAPRKDAETAAADMARARSDVVAAQRLLELSTLRAPISGVVTKMSATLGATADPAQALIEIADPGALDVLLNATPSDAGRVRVGAKVALSAGATNTGDALGIGTVADIAGTVDSAARSVPIRVQAAATRRPLKIGETVFGAIALGTNPSAIVIPSDALVPEGETFKVFVVDQTQTAHAREVKVGGRSERGVEITEGLRAGERIVSTGAYAVSDSAKVVPLTATPGEPVGGEKGDAKKKDGGKDADEAKDTAAAAAAAKPGKP